MTAWMTYKGIDLFRPAGSTAYTYRTKRMEIDADGAPNAYHPNDTGLDFLANAGFPNHWQGVLVADPANPSKPFVQPSGPTQGFFVSMTALHDSTSAATEPQKYVDASRIPYIVFPGQFNQLTGTGVMGDFVMAKSLSSGKVSAAIVADIGPSDAALGEVSMALVTGLGGTNPNPRNGAGKPPGEFRYVVFPRSHKTPKWRLTAAEIDQQAQTLLAAAGGWAAFDNLS
jgi:hypothetical protein